MTKQLIIAAMLVLPGSVFAQSQVTLQTPFQGTRSSFFESFNMGWNFNFGGSGGGVVASFNNGGAGSFPPFGGFNPQAGISSGMHISGGDVSAGFNWGFSQGAQRSFVSQTPVITGIPGQPMFLRSGLQVPFVTGFTPVVGSGFPRGFGGSGFQALNGASSLRQRWEQAQSRPRSNDDQVNAQRTGGDAAPRLPRRNPLLADPIPVPRSQRAQAQKSIQASQDVAAQAYIEKAENAVASGKTGSARVYYRMAARRASAELQAKIREDVARLAE